MADQAVELGSRTAAPTSDGTAPESSGRGSDPAWTRWPAGVALAAGAVTMLLLADVPPEDVLRYAAYWLLAVWVPGLVVSLRVLGRGRTLLEDLGLGAATGIALQIVVTVLLSVVRLDPFAPWWPVAVYAWLVASPGLREAVRPQPYDAPARAWHAWSLSAIAGLAIMRLGHEFGSFMLPPAATGTNIDGWWHVGFIHEMLKPGLPVDPRVAGVPSAYHWFSHVHLAVGSATSGVEATTVYFRLWIIPLVLVVVATVATLARHVTDREWAGPLAVFVSFVALSGGFLWSPSGIPGKQPLSISPSQMLSVALVGAVSIGLVAACRRPLPPTAYAWVGLLLLATVGSKPTALPILFGATLVAAVARSITNAGHDTHLWWLSGVTLLLTGVTSQITGTSGTVTILGAVRSLRPYRLLLDVDPRVVPEPTLVLESLQGGLAWSAAIATVVFVLAGTGLRLAGLATLFLRETRRDAAAWWLAGGMGAGWLAFFVVDQPSNSQHYFLGPVGLLGSVLFTWLVAASTPRAAVARIIVPSLLVGGGIGWAARTSPTWLAGGEPTPIDAVYLPLAIAVPLVLLVLLLAVVVGRGRRTMALLVTSWVLLGLAIPSTIADVSRVVRTGSPAPRPVDPDGIDYLTREEQEGALWLRDNSDELDVVATNLHCRSGQRFTPGCDARGFWLSGLSGRRVWLEGWSYRPEAIAKNGVDGRRYPYQPPSYPRRLELSQAAVTAPTAEVMDELREAGVDWVVAVRRAGDVSPRIGEFATERFTNDLVSIYELRP